MKKVSNRFKQLFLLIILAAGVIFFIYNQADLTWKDSGDRPAATLRIGEKTVKVEIASDEERRAKGFSGRDGLSKDEGLLMVFGKPDRYGIWMKDMKFSIDVFWIRGNKIVHTEKNVPPPVVGTPEALLPIYMSSTEADAVLETAAGFADENGIRSGDSAEFYNSE